MIEKHPGLGAEPMPLKFPNRPLIDDKTHTFDDFARLSLTEKTDINGELNRMVRAERRGARLARAWAILAGMVAVGAAAVAVTILIHSHIAP